MFDLDGTLTASEAVDAACFLDALDQAWGIAGVDTDWTVYPHVTDRGIADALWRRERGRRPSREELGAFSTDLGARLAEALARTPCRPLAGAGEALAALASGGRWATAVATGSLGVSARLKLASAGLAGFDLPLACADDAASRADIVRRAIERAVARHGVQGFGRTVLLGDAAWDLATATELGLPFLAIGPRGAELCAGGASHALPDYRDLRTFERALENCTVPAAAAPSITGELLA